MHTKYITYGNKWKEENFFIFFCPPLSFFKLYHFQQCNNVSTLSKTEITIALLYVLSQHSIRKLKRKKEDLPAITPEVVSAVGTDVDDSLGSLGMVS